MVFCSPHPTWFQGKLRRLSNVVFEHLKKMATTDFSSSVNYIIHDQMKNQKLVVFLICVLLLNLNMSIICSRLNCQFNCTHYYFFIKRMLFHVILGDLGTSGHHYGNKSHIQWAVCTIISYWTMTGIVCFLQNFH